MPPQERSAVGGSAAASVGAGADLVWQDGVGWVGGAPRIEGAGYGGIGEGIAAAAAVSAAAAAQAAEGAEAAAAASEEGCFSAAASVGVHWAGALRSRDSRTPCAAANESPPVKRERRALSSRGPRRQLDGEPEAVEGPLRADPGRPQIPPGRLSGAGADGPPFHHRASHAPFPSPAARFRRQPRATAPPPPAPLPPADGDELVLHAGQHLHAFEPREPRVVAHAVRGGPSPHRAAPPPAARRAALFPSAHLLPGSATPDRRPRVVVSACLPATRRAGRTRCPAPPSSRPSAAGPSSSSETGPSPSSGRPSPATSTGRPARSAPARPPARRAGRAEARPRAR